MMHLFMQRKLRYVERNISLSLLFLLSCYCMQNKSFVAEKGKDGRVGAYPVQWYCPKFPVAATYAILLLNDDARMPWLVALGSKTLSALLVESLSCLKQKEYAALFHVATQRETADMRNARSYLRLVHIYISVVVTTVRTTHFLRAELS